MIQIPDVQFQKLLESLSDSQKEQIVEYVRNDQYVDAINRSMDLQNVYLGVFLAILTVVLGFIGVLQWRLSSKQIETIKIDTKKATIDEMIGFYSIDKVPEIITDVHSQKIKNKAGFDDIQKKVEILKRNSDIKIKKDFYIDSRLVLESRKKKVSSLYLLVKNYRYLLQKEKKCLERVIKLIDKTVIPYLEDMKKMSNYTKETITKIIAILVVDPNDLKTEISNYEEVLERFNSFSNKSDFLLFTEDQEETI